MKLKKYIVIIPLIILNINLLSFNAFASVGSIYKDVESGWKSINPGSRAVLTYGTVETTDKYWSIRNSDSYIEVQFYGTSFRLIGYRYHSYGESNIIIFNNTTQEVVNTTFSARGDDGGYVCLYEITDLPLGNYTVHIQPDDKQYLVVYRLDINVDGFEGFYNISTTSSDLTRTNQYLCYISIINTIILFSFCIFKWLRPFFKELK